MKTWVLLGILLILAFLVPTVIQAGGGHSHGDGGHSHGEEFAEAGVLGPFELSDEAVSNLKIFTVLAKKGTLELSIPLFGQVVIPPRQHYHVPAQFQGRVTALKILQGQKVAKDQELGRAVPLKFGGQEVIFRSPIDGIVTKTPGSIGEVFSEASEVFDVSNLSSMLIRADMYQDIRMEQIVEGLEATASFRALSDLKYRGKLERIDANLKEEVPLYHLYMTVDNSDMKLKPNMRARVEIVLDKITDRLLIPEKAVLGELGQYFVFTRWMNTFERKEIEVGQRGNGFVEVKSGIEEGQRIVVQGHYQLQYVSGSQVKENHGQDHGDHGHSH